MTLLIKIILDDGFKIRTGALTSLLVFAAYANNIHKNIKTKLRQSQESI